jgi:hypothetical protein
MNPGLLVTAALYLFAWMGFAALALGRRIRAR